MASPLNVMDFRYIAVEGPPGVGKTGLAERLAKNLEGRTLLEQKNNPFLDNFLSGEPGRRIPGANFLPAEPLPGARGARTERAFCSDADLGLHSRKRQDLRLSGPRRHGAHALRENLRPTRRRSAGPGARPLSPSSRGSPFAGDSAPARKRGSPRRRTSATSCGRMTTTSFITRRRRFSSLAPRKSTSPSKAPTSRIFCKRFGSCRVEPDSTCRRKSAKNEHFLWLPTVRAPCYPGFVTSKNQIVFPAVYRARSG